MLNLFQSTHRSILGIDISSTAIKILEIAGTDGQYIIKGYGRCTLPENAMEGAVIKDIDAVAGKLRQLLSSSQFTCKQAAIALPDGAVISRVIQINEGMSDGEIEELIAMEADKYIPYPIDEINLDFNVIGPSMKNSAMLDVLIVASRAENVTNRVAAITQAGLQVSIVDVESYAIERTMQVIAPDLPAGGEKKIIAIIDIGAVYTHLFVLYGMKIVFSRDEEFGGHQLIDAIMQHYGMARQDAITALEQGKLPSDYESAVLEPFNELILLQVKRALQFFFSTGNYTYVDYILLAGGVAKLPGLATLLQEHVNITTSVVNPFAHMDFDKSVNREMIIGDAPMLLVACGLALRRMK